MSIRIRRGKQVYGQRQTQTKTAAENQDYTENLMFWLHKNTPKIYT